MDDLPTDYDAIVVGTGMTESVIAAAISRIGKSVLHLDPNDFYGETWASFNLEAFKTWVDNHKNVTEKISDENFNDLIEGSEKLISLSTHSNIRNIRCSDYFKTSRIFDDINKKDDSEDKENNEVENDEANPDGKNELQESVQEQFQKLGRRFNLDLCPKLLFSRGLLVQLLISSNIARYAEFKSVSRVLTWRENQLEHVPCSRADVFATKNVSVVQKRILVKILTLFSTYTENLEEFNGFENKTFLEFLKYKKLPENLIHYILYAIAMGDNKTACLDGVKACRTFLESLGRYGNTPFIFPMYGCGELPQCFCRLCAVFGGIYCLQRGVEGLIIKDEKCVGVISNKKRLNAKAVILSSTYVPKDNLSENKSEYISRGIFITNRSILTGDKESLTLLQYPPVPKVSENSVTVIELGSGTCTCPENYFIVHMTTKMVNEASEDLKHVVESLFDNKKEESSDEVLKPNTLWSCTWNVAKGNSKVNDLSMENLKICAGVDSELDYDFSISEAKSIFKELYPDEEFLPRAPDPDEIVLDNEEEKIIEDSAGTEGGSMKAKTEDKINEDCSVKADTEEEKEKPKEAEKGSEIPCDINEPSNENDHSSES